MARGYSQGDIARELKIARTTVNRDMKYINEMTNKGWYNLAKVTLPTMFFNCIQGRLTRFKKNAGKSLNI